MIRAVLDTVVFVRALINPSGRWGRLVFRLNARYVLVLSPPIAEEALEVVARPRLLRRYPGMSEPARLRRVHSTLLAAEVVFPTTSPEICRDPDDDKLFACALAGNAGYIVSEDEDVLAVGQYKGIRTVSAVEFLHLLDTS